MRNILELIPLQFVKVISIKMREKKTKSNSQRMHTDMINDDKNGYFYTYTENETDLFRLWNRIGG